MPTEVYSDYLFARSNYYEILMKGGLALERLVDIASQTNNRSDYRVIGELIHALTTTNEKLLQMHLDKKELQTEDAKLRPNPSAINIEQGIVLTTTDLLQRLLKNNESNS